MNRFLKVTLISGSICLVLGAALVFGGVVSGGAKLFNTFVENGGLSFGEEDFINEPGISGSFEADKEVSHIKVEDFSMGELMFDVYEGDTITVEYENVRNGFVCKQDGASLIMEYKGEDGDIFDTIKSWGGINDVLNSYVVVHMPKDYVLSSCNISLDAGSVNIEQLDSRDMEVSVDAGSVTIEELKADNTILDVDAGQIVVKGYYGGDVEASCDAGSVSLQGTVNGNIDADCNMGEIDLDLNGVVEKYNYKLSSNMGAVYLNDKECAEGMSAKLNQNNNGDYTITADCDMGEVDINIAE